MLLIFLSCCFWIKNGISRCRLVTLSEVSNLRLSPLELVEEGLRLGPDVQLGVVVHQDDQVGVVDEPLWGGENGTNDEPFVI